MLVGFLIFIAIIITVIISKNIYDYGYERGTSVNEIAADRNLEAFKASQIWEYEDRPEPLIRRNKLTGEVQKRYLVGDILNQHYSGYRTVIGAKLEDSDGEGNKGKTKRDAGSTGGHKKPVRSSRGSANN